MPFCNTMPRRPSNSPPAVSRELVEHYCRNEWAVSPDDIMLRRAGWRHNSSAPLPAASTTRLSTAERISQG